MKKHLRHFICILIIGFISSPIYSQDFLEIGNTWIYEYNDYSLGDGSFVQKMDSIEIIKDTLINGQTYQKLSSSENHPCLIYKEVEFLRQEGNLIYMLSNDRTEELLIIDFDIVDSYTVQYEPWSSGGDPIQTGVAVLDSTGLYTSNNNISLNAQYMKIEDNGTYEDEVQYVLLEKIGFHEFGLLYPYLGIGLCDVSQQVKLRCFKNDKETIELTQFDCYESSVPLATNITAEDDIILYPNPVEGFLTIPDNYEVLSIRDQIGKEILVKRSEFGLDVSDFTPSTYYLKMKKKGTNTFTIKQFIKL